mmetsp:Transcript_28817/g.71888  ORF Transcript_28817/g.71888 Transcript_28817/m.71888 type:complete len:213 (+) Transcript_28817:2002-2640(+)
MVTDLVVDTLALRIAVGDAPSSARPSRLALLLPVLLFNMPPRIEGEREAERSRIAGPWLGRLSSPAKDTDGSPSSPPTVVIRTVLSSPTASLTMRLAAFFSFSGSSTKGLSSSVTSMSSLSLLRRRRLALVGLGSPRMTLLLSPTGDPGWEPPLAPPGDASAIASGCSVSGSCRGKPSSSVSVVSSGCSDSRRLLRLRRRRWGLPNFNRRPV